MASVRRPSRSNAAVDGASCLSTGTFPDRLSRTGCYADVPSAVLSPQLVPYEVVAPLWTDGALKRRAFGVPRGGTLKARGDGALFFPEGTVLLKEFRFRLARHASRERLVETRLMLRTARDWQFATYVWSDDGREAFLTTTSRVLPLDVVEPEGTVHIDYVVPDQLSCTLCHASGAAPVIAVTVPQLDLVRTDAEGRYDQLTALVEAGLLDETALSVRSHQARLVDFRDPSASLSDRARSYLHAQCAHCHQPHGFAPTDNDPMDLRWGLPPGSTRLCATAGASSPSGPRVLPGDPDGSTVWQKIIGAGGVTRMPLIGTTRIDPDTKLVRQWILDGASVQCR
jgi:hypothetical protein